MILAEVRLKNFKKKPDWRTYDFYGIPKIPVSYRQNPVKF